MPEADRPLRIVLAPSARRDIRGALIWSQDRFGMRAATRYRTLLKQALRDLAEDPERPGSRERSDLAQGIRTYHASFSRERALLIDRVGVKKPRHFVVYRCTQDALQVIRILHDARDLDRHLPDDLRGIPDFLDR